MNPELAKKAADMIEELVAVECDDRCPVCELGGEHVAGCELGEVVADLREASKAETGEPPAWLDEDAALHRTDRQWGPDLGPKTNLGSRDQDQSRLGRNLSDLLAAMGPGRTGPARDAQAARKLLAADVAYPPGAEGELEYKLPAPHCPPGPGPDLSGTAEGKLAAVREFLDDMEVRAEGPNDVFELREILAIRELLGGREP
jgi:hypothetical protein